jgi:hypothetical protein
MDHASARLLDWTTGTMETSVIDSKFTHEEKSETLDKSESLMNHKEQHEEAGYYKQLGAAIRNYDQVLLFGATQAKTELYNILRADHRFEKITIGVEPADRLTEPQQEAFVREYFARH